jgi:hypothetical protein
VARALQVIADQAPRRAENGMCDPAAVRYADALVELAEVRLAATDPVPPTLVVHVAAEALAAGEGPVRSRTARCWPARWFAAWPATPGSKRWPRAPTAPR